MIFGNMKHDIRLLQMEVENLNAKYWVLWNRHDRLLNHLKLNEIEIPTQIKLETKGDP